MKKVLPLLFTALCLILCLIPSAGMIFAPSNEAIGNERLSDPPAITNGDGSFNQSYFTELGGWFGKHFAFRRAAIDADAKVMSGVFGTSNVDTVTVGADGWLYYTSSLNDYLGKGAMTSREVVDFVRNLDLIRRYSASKGVDFLFTAAPNKNTLYPSHMPYYDTVKVSGVHNRDLVNAALADSDVPYVNLFDLFAQQSEELYFKRDSHWNNKGALLVYNAVMDTLGKAHDDYSTASVSRRKDFTGDLAKMIFPAGAEPEYNDYYGAEERYTYVTDTASVEDTLITTANPDATGRLYMYRDSFGNALLPFFASAYGDATFTKGFSMLLESDLELYHPDVFIIELVERNLDWVITRPPVLPAPQMSYFKTSEARDEPITAEVKPCEVSPVYTRFSGTVSTDLLEDGDTIYVSVTDASGNTAAYECYGMRAEEEGKTGWLAYARAEDFAGQEELNVAVVIQRGSAFIELGHTTVTPDDAADVVG